MNNVTQQGESSNALGNGQSAFQLEDVGCVLDRYAVKHNPLTNTPYRKAEEDVIASLSGFAGKIVDRIIMGSLVLKWKQQAQTRMVNFDQCRTIALC